MKAKTLKALQKSIQHWKTMAETAWEKEQPVVQQCALCRVFNTPDIAMYNYSACCVGCPVYEKTGHRFCDKTPVHDAYRAFHKGDRTSFLEYANREVVLLESLLPKETK